MAWRYFLDPAIDCSWRGHGHVSEICRESCRIHLAIDPGNGQHSLEFRREDEPLFVFEIQQRFLAKAIAGQQQVIRPAVPHREGEHSVELGNDAVAPFLVPVNDYFGVGLCRESMAERGETRAQLFEVVYLAIENRPDRSILIRDWLMPAGDVDDAEALTAEPGDCPPAVGALRGKDDDAAIVGTAVAYGRTHFFEQPRRDRRTVVIDDARYAAHSGPTFNSLYASRYCRAVPSRPNRSSAVRLA